MRCAGSAAPLGPIRTSPVSIAPGFGSAPEQVAASPVLDSTVAPARLNTVHLALPAHAKLNLTLQVLGVQADGYHRVRTHLQAISLHDLLLVSSAGTTSLEGGFPDDLVLRAASALERAAGRPLPARFQLVKRIPAGGGLAGGSSNAPAA